MSIRSYVISSIQSIDTMKLGSDCSKVTLRESVLDTSRGQNILIAREALTLEDAFAVPVNIPWYIRVSLGNSEYSKQDLISSAALNDKIVSSVFDLAQGLENKLSSYCAELRVVCNTMAQDFYVLIPATKSKEAVEKICYVLRSEINSKAIYHDPDIEKLTKKWNQDIEVICGNNCFWIDTRHKEFYASCIQTLLQRTMLDPDMKMGDVLLASLVLKKCQHEVCYRWTFDSGDICIEDAAFFKEYEEEFKKYSKWLRQYIEQSAQDAPLANWNRALLNLTQALSNDLLDKRYSLADEENSEWADQKEQLKRNFYGLYPVIVADEGTLIKEDEHDDEIFSYYPMHYSDEFCYGFLCVSIKMLDRLERFIPAYTHELFHYIPPISREHRNKVLIELVTHSLLVHLRDKLGKALTKRFGEGTDTKKLCEDVYYCYFEGIKEYINSGLEYFSHSNDIPLNTMNLGTLLPLKTFLDSPRKFFEVLRGTELHLENHESIACAVGAEVAEILSEFNFKKECMFIWEYEAESYTTTFNSILRELRSDFAMCSALDLGLQDYLRIMANEPNWASLDKTNTADSVYIRLGIMTRLLYNRDRGADEIFPRVEELEAWRSYCISKLDQLKKESQAELYLTYLENMKDYISEYEKISIESCDGYPSKGESILEKTLEGLLREWEREIDSYKDIPLMKWLSSVYKQNKDGTKAEWLIGACSLLRDFHHYIPSYSGK